jgi:hypothetical protein
VREDGRRPTTAFGVPRGEKTQSLLETGALFDLFGLVSTTAESPFHLNVVPGAAFLAVGIVETETKSDPTVARPATQIGAGMLVAGGVLLIPGIVLWAANGTSVTTQDGRRLAKSGPRFTPSGLVF